MRILSVFIFGCLILFGSPIIAQEQAITSLAADFNSSDRASIKQLDAFHEQFPQFQWHSFLASSKLFETDSLQKEFALWVAEFSSGLSPVVLQDILAYVSDNNEVHPDYFSARVGLITAYLHFDRLHYDEGMEVLQAHVLNIDKETYAPLYEQYVVAMAEAFMILNETGNYNKLLLQIAFDDSLGKPTEIREAYAELIQGLIADPSNPPDSLGLLISGREFAKQEIAKGNYQQANRLFQESLFWQVALQDHIHLADSYSWMGLCHAHLDQSDSMSIYFKLSIEALARANSPKAAESVFDLKAQAHEVLGDTGLAYQALKKSHSYGQTRQKREFVSVREELRTKYETAEKELQNEILTYENKEQARSIQQRNFIIFTALGLVFLLIVVTLMILRINRKTRDLNHQLQEVQTSREHFFSNITHEFRTPLTLIISPLEKWLQETEASREKLFELLQNNKSQAQRLLQLVNQLLSLNKIQSGAYSLSPTVGDFHEMIDQVINGFRPVAQEKGLQLTLTNNINGNHLFDASAWKIIMTNLIGNAFKFTPSGAILVTISENTPGAVNIRVKDTGVGIPDHQLKRIFDRFYQVPGKNASSGTGIGLSMVHELVSLMNGNIEVSSSHEGTTFSILVPLEKVQIETIDKEQNGTNLASHIFERESVLVVDDNDELRQFLVQELGDQWNVAQASNGLEAWEYIQKNLPEIVISDVMMPKMDGFQLCEKVKSDSSTNHISMVLLTARASNSAVVTGLGHGADDYITKPFHPTELQLRIQNQLEQRKRLKEHLKDTLQGNSLENHLSSKFEKVSNAFIQKAIDCVNKNLENEALSAEWLASELAISKSTLNRKLRSLLDTSSVEFIRDIRLNRSVEYLKAGYSVSEAAYSVGFESPSYFTKTFKNRFNQTPSEFAPQVNKS